MTKKKDSLRPRSNEPLVDRLRHLWQIAESIELAQKQGRPLSKEFSEELQKALKQIACGVDANEALNVQSRQGQRRDVFRNELARKIQLSFIAAATEVGVGRKKTATAIKEISAAMPDTKQSTIRKDWNKSDANRDPCFTLGKK